MVKIIEIGDPGNHLEILDNRDNLRAHRYPSKIARVNKGQKIVEQEY